MSDKLKQYRECRKRMNARISPHLRRAMATLADIAAERLPEA